MLLYPILKIQLPFFPTGLDLVRVPFILHRIEGQSRPKAHPEARYDPY